MTKQLSQKAIIMTDKFQNIESEEVKLNKDGEIELTSELAKAVSGRFNPEEDENETHNFNCVFNCVRETELQRS